MDKTPFEIEKRVYMIVAAVAATIIFIAPAFVFMPDEGIYFTKSFVVNAFRAKMIYTNVHTGISHVESTLYFWPLTICQLLMVLMPVLGVFAHHRRKLKQYCMVGMSFAIFYLIGVVVYCVVLSGDWFATSVPNWPVLMAIVEALVLRRAISHLCV